MEWQFAEKTEIVGEHRSRCYFVHHNSYLGWNPSRRRESRRTTQTLCCRSSNYCSGLTGSNSTRDRFFSDSPGSLIFLGLLRAVDHDDLSLQPFPAMWILTSHLTLATTYFLCREDSGRAKVVVCISEKNLSTLNLGGWWSMSIWWGKGNATINYFATIFVVLIDPYRDLPV